MNREQQGDGRRAGGDDVGDTSRVVDAEHPGEADAHHRRAPDGRVGAEQLRRDRGDGAECREDADLLDVSLHRVLEGQVRSEGDPTECGGGSRSGGDPSDDHEPEGGNGCHRGQEGLVDDLDRLGQEAAQ